MYDDVRVERTAPALHVTESMLGAKYISKMVNALTDTRHDPPRLSSKSLALFAPSGYGKTAVASAVLAQVRMRLPWLTTLHAPFLTSVWLASQVQASSVCDFTGENVMLHLSRRRLVVIDGLGEEPDKYRDRAQQLTKQLLDHGRPMIITSRMPIDGPDSLAKYYPHIRAALDSRFMYFEPKR